MKERPIIFSLEMVRAILDGRKTVTRRVVKGLTGKYKRAIGWQQVEPREWKLLHRPEDSFIFQAENRIKCPYGQPGDRLWVRETWFCTGADESDGCPVKYLGDATINDDVSTISWRPSIFMPRWASRITLEVTGVRVESLQNIALDDGTQALKEGVGQYDPKSETWRGFARLWDSINAKRGFGWDKNPWVWVVEFLRVTS